MAMELAVTEGHPEGHKVKSLWKNLQGLSHAGT